MSERLLQRKGAQTKSTSPAPTIPPYRAEDVEYKRNEDLKGGAVSEKHGLLYSNNTEEDPQESKRIEWLFFTAIFLIAAAFRFYKIDYPDGVVFDEVHFGKFASYYIRREYFFDVHPPLFVHPILPHLSFQSSHPHLPIQPNPTPKQPHSAKLLLAFAGWAIGYDGHFEFENIGDNYIDNNVPFVGLRTLPAILGSLVPVVVYAIMRESGYPRIVGVLSASLVLIDNAHVVQTRLILLDAPLVLFMALSFYSYIRFYKLRYSEFTKPWWTWMVLTGVFLSLTISCKMVGLFAFMTVGSAVVWDLWNLLDIKRGLSIEHVAKHFGARVIGLILVPACVYLFWFWVHFAVLTKSGTGDDFMSPAFQLTLDDSPLTLNAEEIRYYDTVIFQHKATKAFLHSHPDKYPLKYDDGRISSAGQQVTGYPFNDTNNHWIVEPTKEIPDTGRGRIVREADIVKFRHVNTNTTLLTHDVACPTMATNTEFTTWDGIADTGNEEDTHFKIEILDAHPGQQWMTKSAHFQLVHVNTGVVMWSHTDPVLPDWAYKQQEINGSKNKKDKTTYWVIDDLVRDPDSIEAKRHVATPPEKLKKKKTMSFFRKFFELQIAMLQHNAGLTDSHPYASGPINWPFLLSGISFWTGKNDDKEQVYMIGNVVSWWLCVMAVSVFVGILGADQLAKRRGLTPIPDATRNRLYNSGGFFMLAWVYHYFPFFSMSRQLFLHHYLPAHLCSALVAGAVFHFVSAETINFPVSVAGPTTRRRPRTRAEVSKKMILAVGIIIIFEVIGYAFLAPLTYGTPLVDPDMVNRRRILSSWTLHYAK